MWKDDRLVERIDKDKFLLSYREHFLNEITKIKLEFKDKYDMIEKLPEKIRLLLNDGKNNLQKIMYDFFSNLIYLYLNFYIFYELYIIRIMFICVMKIYIIFK